MTGSLRRLGVAVGGVVLASAVSAPGRAQRVDPEAPRTFVVGQATGARADRVDGSRRGRSLSLPHGELHVAWRTAVGTAVDHPALVDARGGSYVVGVHGDVVALTPEGAERWHVATGAAQPGPAALLSDDTVVFADAGGQALAVRDGAVRWRVRFARPDVGTAAPLPLDDGGVVVATTREIALLDVDGDERARAALPEPMVGSLIWAGGRVIAVGSAGTVWSWGLGDAAPTRAGTFGSAIDAGAALLSDDTLLAITTRDSALVAVDLRQGTTSVRATSRQSPWRGPVAIFGGLVFVLSAGPSGEQVSVVDPSGEERLHAILSARTASVVPGAADAGVVPSAPAGPTGPLVDSSGTLAFATRDGTIGVAHPLIRASSTAAEGGVSVDVVARACPVPFTVAGAVSAALPPVAGLAALPGPGEGLLGVCRTGVVVALTSDVQTKAL